MAVLCINRNMRGRLISGLYEHERKKTAGDKILLQLEIGCVLPAYLNLIINKIKKRKKIS